MTDRYTALHRHFGRLCLAVLSAWMLTLFPSACPAAPPKNLRFEQLGIEQGLPHELVQAMLQDQQGFIWIGTQSGLARYDGVSIIFYRPDASKPNSLAAPWVTALYQDGKGRLWVGTRGGGLQRYNPADESFIRYNSDTQGNATAASKQIIAIKGDGAHGMWLATMDGLAHFDMDSEKFSAWHHDAKQSTSLVNDQITDLTTDARGNLWIATPSGIDRLSRGSTIFEHFRLDNSAALDSRGNDIHALLVDRNGSLWIGTAAGLEVWSPSGEKRRIGPKEGLSSGITTAIYQDQDGAIWVGTQDDGLKRLEPNSNSFQSYRNQSSDPHSLADNRIVTLLQDRSGVLWVGTWNRGISRVDLVGGGFDRLVHLAGEPHTIGAGRIQGIAAADHGKIWLGSSEGGLNRLDRRTGEVEHFTHHPEDPNSLSHNTVRAVQVNAQGVWVGTAAGLDLLDPVSGRFRHFVHEANNPLSLASNQIYSLYFDRQGMLWVGTMDAGLDRFDPAKQTFEHFPHRSQDPHSLIGSFVTTLLEDAHGYFWVGTSSGLDLFDRKSGRGQHFQHNEKESSSLSQNTVTDLLEDRSGNLWVSTTSGLNRVEREADGSIRFKRYTMRGGQQNNVVLDIEEASNGNLWLGTNAGLSRFDPGYGNVANFTSANGLIDGTYMVGGSFKDQDGHLYFGGTRGLTVFDPAAIRDNVVSPQVVLTDFLIFNKSVRGAGNTDGFNMSGAITHAKEVTLSYINSVFSIEFAALHFADPMHNRYAYKLEGFDKDWVYTDANHRVATYTNLEAGQYVFHVRAATKEGSWNDTGANLTIIITPPFWKTWWFRLIMALLVLGTISLAYRARIRNFARQQILLEGQVRTRTAEALAARAVAEAKSRQISTLLDNSGQGFLSFAANLRVDAEYSLECENIFDRSIEGVFLPALLYPDDKQRMYIEKNLNHIFNCGDDANRREMYMELLPEEYRFHGRDYEAKYRFLSDNRIMLILTDVSDEKALQRKVHQERKRVDFLVNAMENRNDLLDTLQAWRQFLEHALPRLLHSVSEPAAILTEIHREIHTYKGLFAQDGLLSMPVALHDLEDQLAELFEHQDIDMEVLIRTLDAYDLSAALESDLALLREKLGATYFAADKLIQLPASALDQLEQAILATVDTHTQAGASLLEELHRLQYQPLSSLLTQHFKAVAQIAERQGKELALIRYEGDEIQIDPRTLTPFCKSLVHVFRNCIDHGVEDAETRLRAGKNEIGHIHCRVRLGDDNFKLYIGDDGHGVDREQVRARALALGLLSPDKIAAISESALLRLIFLDGLSTREQVTQISGRGIGLAATLHELEKLGGTVEVVSTLGAGTEFCFTLPLHSVVGATIVDQRIVHEFEQQ